MQQRGRLLVCDRCEANDAVGFDDALSPWLEALWPRLAPAGVAAPAPARIAVGGPDRVVRLPPTRPTPRSASPPTTPERASRAACNGESRPLAVTDVVVAGRILWGKQAACRH